MGMENSLISMVREVALFNSFEAIFFLGIALVELNRKLSIKKGLFHIIMLSFLDYLSSNFVTTTIPLLIQVIILLGLSVYFSIVFRIKIIKSIVVGIKALGFLFIIEIILAILINNVFHVELISMNNDGAKFLYMIPFRIVEILFIYIYYLMKRGVLHYGKTSKTSC